MRSQKPLSRLQNILVQDLQDEVLVYDLANGKAYCLNQTSALIWRECDGNSTIAEIGRNAGRRLGKPVQDDIVLLAVDQLKKDNLLENGDEITTPFAGLSRREAAKRIGFASMVALPVIASVVAPSALHAQSAAVCECASVAPNSRPPGCFCSSDAECCSGVCFLMTVCQNLAPVGPACCPGAANCGTFPLSAGCLCLDNTNCASGLCDSIAMVCQI